MLCDNTDNFFFSFFLYCCFCPLCFPDQSLEAVTLSAPVVGRQARVVGGV